MIWTPLIAGGISFLGAYMSSLTARYQCYGINADAELTASIEYAVQTFPMGANKDLLRKLLKETAISESNYGRAIYNSKRGFGYGAFQFDPIGMKQAVSVAEQKGQIGKIRALSLTTSPLTLENYKEVYLKEFQLKSTLQSILCRFYYLGVKEAIPETLEGRGRYWKKYYNSELGAGTPEKYVARVTAFAKANPSIYQL